MTHLRFALLTAFACVPLAGGCVVTSDDGASGGTGATGAATGAEASGGSGGDHGAQSSGGTTSAGGSTGASGSATAEATTASTGGPTAGDASTSGASTTGADSGDPVGGGTIDVTLGGCTVDLGGTVVVSYNGSLGVASVYDSGATLTGSFQFDLDGTGVYTLSTQQRVDTGMVVNLVDVGQGTWTNLDSDALSGGDDSIGGTLTVSAWDSASGVSDLAFEGVSLLNVSSGNVCTIDGTIVTEQLYP